MKAPITMSRVFDDDEYDEYKRDEFARFMSTVTEWDNEMYMECLP